MIGKSISSISHQSPLSCSIISRNLVFIFGSNPSPSASFGKASFGFHVSFLYFGSCQVSASGQL